MTADDLKTEARARAALRRAAAHADATPESAAHLQRVLGDFTGMTISGYVPIRTEIDPMPALHAAHAAGSAICLPVIDAPATPLRFRAWQPGAPLTGGALNTQEPADGAFLRPDVVVLPLLAFAADGRRLGYGGGFYDRTLQALRAAGPVIAIGFAYEAQRDDALPIDPFDQPLDLIVTEARIIDLRG